MVFAKAFQCFSRKCVVFPNSASFRVVRAVVSQVRVESNCVNSRAGVWQAQRAFYNRIEVYRLWKCIRYVRFGGAEDRSRDADMTGLRRRGGEMAKHVDWGSRDYDAGVAQVRCG